MAPAKKLGFDAAFALKKSATLRRNLSKVNSRMPAAGSGQTVSDALHTATAMLTRTSDSPRLDAELLLEHVTGLSRTQFRAAPERELPTQAGWSFQQLVKRRMQGEPIAYIRGHQEFWSLLFEVSPAVLIPRPETELVVERALEHLAMDAQSNVLDLGTGSGAIALSIANERPNTIVTAIDQSVEALAVATRNAARLQIGNVRLLQSNWYSSLTDTSNRFDLIVSNPPYIALDDPDLHPLVRRHEPTIALIPGPSGMEAIKAIVTRAPQHLSSSGWVILEHGWKQSSYVRDLLVHAGFAHVRSHADLAGHERVTEAQWVGNRNSA
jgi:release factor glutamine methyltransferase